MIYLPTQKQNFDLTEHSEYVDDLQQLLGGVINLGNLDLVTEDYLVVVTQYSNWKQALSKLKAQSNVYAQQKLVLAVYGAKPDSLLSKNLSKINVNVIWRLNGKWQTGGKAGARQGLGRC